jgi:hypothetical protein
LDKLAFFEEATFLSCFAVDYGLTVILGQDSPDRKEILAISRDKIIQRLGPDFGHIIANGLNQRLTNYAVAYHQALNESNKPEMVPYIIGEIFNIFYYGDKSGDPEVSVKAGVHFCEVVEIVTRFLKSIRIVRSDNSLVLYKQLNPIPESSEENYFIDFIGAELKKDIDYLVGLA